MGEWLKINGEAIYETSRWKTSAQWSEGRKDYKDKSGDMLLKITIDPDPGYAVKEVFYTWNESKNSLFAIFPKYPDNKKLVLKDMQLPENTSIQFLSTNEKVSWKQQGNDVEVMLPDYSPNKITVPYAYVLKIGNYGKFTKKAHIKTAYINKGLQPLVTITADGDDVIRFTTDGSEPTVESAIYTKPFMLDKTAVVKAIAFHTGSLPGAVVSEKVMKHEWMNAVAITNLKPGISYQYYEPSQNINLVAAFNTPVVGSGVADIISLAKKQRTEKIAFDFKGFIKIGKAGIYNFYTVSDDGSKLFIDDIEVVNNDGDHGSVEAVGKAALKKGFHTIRVQYYDAGGGNELKAMMQEEGGAKVVIPAGILFHAK
jgi:hypothetical protein